MSCGGSMSRTLLRTLLKYLACHICLLRRVSPTPEFLAPCLAGLLDPMSGTQSLISYRQLDPELYMTHSKSCPQSLLT